MPPHGRRWRRSIIASTLALALPAHAAVPGPAPAPACLTEAEVRAMMAFAMPSALNGLITHCSPHVPASGFMRQSGAPLVASYARGKQAAWPRAKTAFLKFAGEEDPASVELVSQMPDSALQPFIEVMIGGLIGSKLKPAQCTLADKMIRLLAPLPPENTVELIGTIVALTGSESKKGASPGIAVCKS